MPHHIRKKAKNILGESFLQFLSAISFGLLGSDDAYWCNKGKIGRMQFWQNYVLAPLMMVVCGLIAFWLLRVYGYLGRFSFDMRKLIFLLLLSPAIFANAIGQIKRLRDMNLPPLLALLNFIPIYGLPLLSPLILILLGGIKAFPKRKKSR